MKTSLYAILLGILLALTLACGYSSGASNMPAISHLNPGSTRAGAGAFMLTVNGTNFASQAAVNWNGNAQATTYVTSRELTIAVPASAVATSGTVHITVTNPATRGNGMYGASPAETSKAIEFSIR